MTVEIQARVSGVIDTEKTEVVSIDKETCARLIQDLVESLADVSVGRLVLKTSDDRFVIFRVKT